MIKSQQLQRRESLNDPVSRWDRMLEIRYFEDRIKELFAEGLVHGTTHTYQGQEAIAIGIAMTLRPTDNVCCTYRSHGIALALGMTTDSVLGEIMGRAIGSIGGVGGSMHLSDASIGLLPTSAIVGGGIPVAAGAALSAQVLGEDRCAVAVFGDGASNIGAFHEGLNLASVWKLPVVFICENNVYGEYSRINLTTSVEDISIRAESYSMPTEIIDGQSVDKVAQGVARAVERARSGGGPTLLECKTYRYSGHSRADAGLYRPAGELEEWLKRDPIDLYEAQLIEAGLLSKERAQTIRQEIQERIAQLVERVMASPLADVSAMFRNISIGGGQ
ncbi:MAG: thiamine pyrophosphate-dependent dehydrogenase E1 component subunit alpha [Acidimicrobiaceae bacterium]|nr:thiamine pyrophosphate-dependent dehydrogenase E1 component subunit alpha [Acidimicrobiaceae bacterium]